MNVLQALKHLIDNKYSLIDQTSNGLRRANTAGDSLEGYIKDAFAGSMEAKNAVTRELAWNKTFSYQGSANNPPDAMIWGGVAIETKKISGYTGDLALNSSHPKSKLRKDDSKISESAKIAEEWTEKDLVYAIGTVKGGHLKRLWLIYGDCLAADASFYSRTQEILSKLINESSGLTLAETNEIANIRQIDPLNRSKLRIRGMWSLKNPNSAFKDLTSLESSTQFYVMLRETTYLKLPEADRNMLESMKVSALQNRIVNIPDPDDSSREIEARFISYEF
jgi:hypothetical protein